MNASGLAQRLRLDGRIALVTGGGAGIGRASALALAAQGAGVAVLDVNGEAAEDTAQAMRAAGASAAGFSCDIAHAQTVKATVAAVLERFGRLDIVVNGAGVASAPGMPFTNNSEQDWERTLAINLMGAVHVCNASRLALLNSDQGRIVNISSITGVISAAYMPPYSVSKAALISLSKVLARDLAPQHVCVNAVCPGFIWTPMWESLGKKMRAHAQNDTDAPIRMDEARAVFDARIAQHVPMLRPQTLDDVADIVVFLSSAAATNITGQVINVDGGVTI